VHTIRQCSINTLSLSNIAVTISLTVMVTMGNNGFTGTVEPICDVIPERRVSNNYAIYLRFFYVDCAGDPPPVECSCCTCV
jgi:hypothetical protein